MNGLIKRTIAAVTALAAVCTPLSPVSAVRDSLADHIVASAGYYDQEQRSGTWSRYTSDYQDEIEGVHIGYTTYGDGAVITGCITSRRDTTIRIPKQLGGKDVIAVADEAFKGQTNIVSVQFYGSDKVIGHRYSEGNLVPFIYEMAGGSKIAEIGVSAFEGCDKLSSVYFGGEEVTIKDSAFRSCTSLTDMFWDNDVDDFIDPLVGDIGSYAFAYTRLRYFERYTCKNIGSHAFYGCNYLYSVDLTALTVGDDCFSNCSRLNKVKIKADSIGDSCFSNIRSLYSANIEAENIGTQAFSGCTALFLLSLIGTKTIGSHAFCNCTSLTYLDYPKTLESVGPFAFYGSSKLRSPLFMISENGESLNVGRAAFCYTGTEYVVLSGNNVTVDAYAFDDCKLRAAVVEGNVFLGRDALGTTATNDPIFRIYGTADSNEYAASHGFNYVKSDKTGGFKKVIDQNKLNFTGARDYHAKNGSCAGMAIMQLMTITGKIDIYDYIPREYKGKEVRGLIDVPPLSGKDEWRDQYPEFRNLTDHINYIMERDEHDIPNQFKYLKYTNAQYITQNNLDGYAKLAEFGVSVPGYLSISSHSHGVLFMGVEKLAAPVSFPDAYKDPQAVYDYRIIISDNGYMYKMDENGDPSGDGFDHKASASHRAPMEDIQIYVRLTDGRCYFQRYDDKINVDTDDKIQNYDQKMITLSNLKYLPASTVEYIP